MASGSWQPRKGAPNVSVGKREWRTPSPQFASVWPQGRAGAFCFLGRSFQPRDFGRADDCALASTARPQVSSREVRSSNEQKESFMSTKTAASPNEATTECACTQVVPPSVEKRNLPSFRQRCRTSRAIRAHNQLLH